MKTIFDQDANTTTTFEEEADGTVNIVKKMNDMNLLLDINKEKYNSNNTKDGALGRHAATVPMTVYQNWIKETNGAILYDQKLMAKYLNNVDYRYLRTHNSRV
jgi:hypothetical protein